jgi:hypothetical protein
MLASFAYVKRGHPVETTEQSMLPNQTTDAIWMSLGLLPAVAQDTGVLSQLRFVTCRREKGKGFSPDIPQGCYF